MGLFKGKERAREQAPVLVVEEVVGVDEDEGDSSSDAVDSDEDGGSGSPVGSLAFTSGPNSQEDAGNKSPRHVLGFGSPIPSPLSSPLRACFPEPGSEEPEPEQHEAIATDLENLIGVSASSLSSPPSEQDGPVLETTSRYPSWLADGVLPLAEFIDDSSDPRALFTDLQEIAQGESGSVYSACATPTIASQFQPPTPTSPLSEIFPKEDGADEGFAQSKRGLVAIKCVPLLRGRTEKLADLRRELELAHALRHANVLRMERLYVDVAEESLWIGMELMDRSLADVLAVVGEEVVEMSETMVARFVRDVSSPGVVVHRKHHIAHRDVRSDNLLLSRSGVLKLSDFSNAVCSPPGTPKRSDSVGVIYWQAPEMRTGLYDPLKVDVWSLGATTWELVHGSPPFEDVKDTRDIVGGQLPPVREPEAFSRSFHDFLHLCSHPAASRPDPEELLDAEFVRTACPRSEIVRLLGQCRTIDEQQIRRQSNDDL
ncbi:kinase-like domain-containing protein [Russula aff. rugulosa BPL654]|nr:kinase-like domain-containing protein [Russula aff. rugulosa BPL654]